MTAKPLVTAIIPTYNRASVLHSSIESVLGQTYKGIEVIVIDDGSTDETASVLDRFGARIHVLRQRNGGPAAARNLGIRSAKGELVGFLDSDDLWLPKKVERQVALLEKLDSTVSCCVCNAEMHFADRPVTTSFRNARLNPSNKEGLWLNPAQTLVDHFLLFNQTVLVRRRLLREVGGFDEGLRYLEDYDLAMKLSLFGPFAFMLEPLVIYYEGSPNSLAREAEAAGSSLKELEVKVRQSVLDAAVARGHTHLQKQMRRALVKARRDLWVARLGERPSRGPKIAHYLLGRAERYRSGLFRRSPWIHRMKTHPIRLGNSVAGYSK